NGEPGRDPAPAEAPLAPAEGPLPVHQQRVWHRPEGPLLHRGDAAQADLPLRPHEGRRREGRARCRQHDLLPLRHRLRRLPPDADRPARERLRPARAPRRRRRALRGPREAQLPPRPRRRPGLPPRTEELRRDGGRPIILSLGYRPDAFRELATREGLEVSVEPAPLGTGGGLRNAFPLVRSDAVMAMNGDSYAAVDLGLLAALQRRRKARALMLLA